MKLISISSLSSHSHPTYESKLHENSCIGTSPLFSTPLPPQTVPPSLLRCDIRRHHSFESSRAFCDTCVMNCELFIFPSPLICHPHRASGYREAFQMRPRISFNGSVRPSVCLSVRPLTSRKNAEIGDLSIWFCSDQLRDASYYPTRLVIRTSFFFRMFR